MHGSLYVCASVYRCICMDVYMYMHVFYVCVDKHGSLYVCASVYRCISETDVAIPVRAVCKPHSPDLKKRRSSD